MSFKHIEINIWKPCNNKCKFCMSSKPELSDNIFTNNTILRNKLKFYREEGYNSVWFLGWDVSIYPWIIDLISYTKELWFESINLVTNAIRFSDEVFAEKIIRAWANRINISIHSHIPEIENYLTSVPGWLERKLRAIDNLNDLNNKWILKNPISINIVLNQKNYKTIVESVIYFNQVKKINDIRINFVRLSEDVTENWDDLKISYTEILLYIKKIIYLSIKYNIRITFDTIPACIFYIIDNKNYKTLIEKFIWENKDTINKIDNINLSDIFDWKERKINELKTKFSSCKKCIFDYNCEWVRKEYKEIYWGKEFLPINK